MSDQPIDMRPDHAALVRDILLARLPKGVRVWVFGSRATWTAKPYSDLDLALEAEDCLPDALIADLKDEFRESDLPWKVDVLDLNAIAPSFRKLIDEDRVGFSLREEWLKYTLNDWEEVKLGDYIDIKHGYAFKSAFFGEDDNGVILLTPGNFAIGGGFKSAKTKFYNGEIPTDYLLKQGDIVLTMTDLSKQSDTLGYPARVPSDECKYLHNQRLGKLVFKKLGMDDGFLYYLLCSSHYRNEILAGATGTSIKHTAPNRIEGFKFYKPPLPEQRAIAAILGSLDDKIELNRRMNETLEAMARAIFKDWFVDFGPTRAKMEGREPYLAPEIWDLFPDKLDDEGKPEGWEVSEIGKETTVVGGSTPSTKEPLFWGGGINWATPKDLSALKSPVLFETNRTVTATGLEKISSGLLPTGTVLLSSRAPIGYIAISAIPVAVNQGFIALRCDGRLSNIYVWRWLHENMETIKGNANGSTFQEISKKNFRPLPVVVPSEEVILEFNNVTMPLYGRIAKNSFESRTLAQTRDLLLPKLMSGEIRIREVEKLTGDVA